VGGVKEGAIKSNFKNARRKSANSGAARIEMNPTDLTKTHQLLARKNQLADALTGEKDPRKSPRA